MSLAPYEPAAPSWLPTITVGALTTLLVQFLTLLLPAVLPGLGFVGSCCCGVAALPLGLLVAVMAWRRDPTLTAGQGFTVSFIACGLGTAVTALLLIVESPNDREGFRREFRDMMREVNRDADPATRLAPEVIEQFADTAAAMAPFVPAVGAIVCTVLAALTGQVTVMVLRSQRYPPGSPPPS